MILDGFKLYVGRDNLGRIVADIDPLKSVLLNGGPLTAIRATLTPAEAVRLGNELLELAGDAEANAAAYPSDTEPHDEAMDAALADLDSETK